ncbi:site-specific tyrosine recombinase XerC [Puniceicoccaceae bacterium K14]|nr:site-specific tyrosine recombinase XerC [Puniceicoccaceae bacterium K14]
MPKKGEKLDKMQVGDPSDPLGFAALRDMHLDYLAIRNYASTTVRNRENYINRFALWCEERSLVQPGQITKQILERYQKWLFNYRDPKNGKKLSFRSQHARLLPLRAFFKWLCQRDLLPANPAADLDLPRVEKRLPRHVLNPREAELVLGQADTLTAMGLRDRAMMEVLYSTGIRRMEIANLKVYDLDPDRMLVFVRLGKGKKDRMVPIGERALAWTNRYLEESRPSLESTKSDDALFLTNLGEAFTPNRLTQMVRDYVKAADLGKTGSCHLFRHAAATHMLENGADTRMIQALLGHARLETTQIYTHLSIKQLQQVHAATHPTAKIGKNNGS